jgi:hypothetical protein
MALTQLQPGSEDHLRATFLAAITMTHEIGHVVFQQDFRSLDYDSVQGYEPWVGRDCWAELGLSYIGWIFSGYNPIPCAIGNFDHPWDFHAPLAWFKQFTIDERPLYETAYSIGIKYLEEVLSNGFWLSLGNSEDNKFSKAARRKLHPALDSVEPRPATAMLPQWKWSRHEGPLWKTKFNDRRATSGPIVTPEEVQWEQAQLEIRYPHTRTILWNGHLNTRFNLLEAAHKDEGGKVGPGPSINLNTEPSLNSLREPDLPPREMDDGFISPDLPKDQRESTNVLLTVRYRPETILTPPPRGSRKTYMNDPNDPEKGERFNGEDYDPNNLTAILDNKVDHKIPRMTCEQAFEYCEARNIRFGLDYQDDDTWQKSRLGWTEDGNWGLIQRIKRYSFHRLEERFKDSPSKLVQIKEFASRNREWLDQNLVDFSEIHGLSTNGDTHNREIRVQTWMEMDLEAARAALPEREAENFTQTSKYSHSVYDEDLTKWSEADFMAFFSASKLPTWGSRDTWEQRVCRFRKEEEAGGEVSRWAINQDALGIVLRTRNGVEIYRFEANLRRTSVAILKTELLVIGMFPSDSILDLYFGPDRQNALEDDKPLSFYEGKTFRDMWLEVRRAEFDDGRLNADEEPLVYEPPTPVRKVSSVRCTAPDPSLKRTYDIMEGNVAPTITERMQQVGQLASRLIQATEAVGRRDILHTYLKGRKSTSGAEMLDDLEDLEELQEEEREALKRAIVGGKENEVPSDDEDDGVPRGHESSYMAEMYRSIDPHCA